jgi:hypothetical protein
MASLEESDVPFDKALALSAGACGETSMAAIGRSTANGNSAEASRFPPFMRWALFHSEPAVARKRALHMAAALYRDASDHSMRRARIVAPIIGLVLLGGSVTLLYGLALFVPVVQMLKAVASAN